MWNDGAKSDSVVQRSFCRPPRVLGRNEDPGILLRLLLLSTPVPVKAVHCCETCSGQKKRNKLRPVPGHATVATAVTAV